MRRRARLLTGAGYLALFSIAFYVAFVLFFPVDSLRRHLVAAVGRDSSLTLLVSDLRMGWDGDLTAERVALAWPQAGGDVPLLVADRVDVHVALLPLARGRLDVAFTGAAYGGRIAGAVVAPLAGGPAERVMVRLDKLDLARHAGLARLLPVVVTGRLSGEVALAREPAPGRPASGAQAASPPLPGGSMRLVLEEGTLRELPMLGAALPQLGVERATASARLAAGRVEVETLEARGPELSASVVGQVLVGPSVPASSVEATVRLRPERRLPPTLLRMLTAFSKAPDPTGAYAYSLRGPLHAPQFRPL
jgi:type II secretion system protein N